MVKMKPKPKPGITGRFKQSLRKTLLAGLLVIIPLALTIYILDLIVRTGDSLHGLLPEPWRPPEHLLFPGSGLLFAVVIVFIAGLFVRNFIGRAIVGWFNSLVERIPLVASIYKLLRQIAEAFLGSEKGGFKEAVLVEWPRRDAWTIAFVGAQTKGLIAEQLKPKGDDFINLFVPTTPNPTSGFFFMVRRRDVIPLDMSVDMAFKTIVSGGTLTPDEIAARELAEK